MKTKGLNQAVKRHIERFPEDIMFQLTEDEYESLRSQFVTSNEGQGGRRYLAPEREQRKFGLCVREKRNTYANPGR